ncbi:MAG: RDD family protein [Proteobacteria bacterium]|nr:RDD family protein [Pseudomonadota bacterium]
MSEQIFVVIDAQKQGPFTTVSLSSMAASGAVNAQTLCWQEGMQDWQPLGVIFPGVAESVPPPLPTQANSTSIKQDFQLAAIGDRVIAAVLDLVVFFVLEAAFFFIPFVGGILSFAIYSVFFMCNEQMQGTPGMRIMNIKIVDANGNTLSFGAALFDI